MKEYDLFEIPTAYTGASFHGEVWIRCPHCDRGMEMMGATPVAKQGDYAIYKCSCGKMFKVR